MIDGLTATPVDYRQHGFWRQLWRFSRPHTIVGTTISLFCLVAMAEGLFGYEPVFTDAGAPQAEDDLLSFLSTSELLWTWLAILAANVYIVGLNQLTDIPLDRINKPYLPLASGAWTVRRGWTVVLGCLALSLAATAWLASGWLWWTVGLSLLLGTVYSLPPIRLKQYAFWAAFCIIAVRSLIVNLLLLGHVSAWRSSVFNLPPYVWHLVFVMFAFSIAIAWFKDMPDLLGDAQHGIRTLSVQLGPRRVLYVGAGVLIAILTVSVALSVGFFENTWLTVGQGVVLLLFGVSVTRVDVAEKISLRRFYLTMWGIFFLEYVVFAVGGFAS